MIERESEKGRKKERERGKEKGNSEDGKKGLYFVG